MRIRMNTHTHTPPSRTFKGHGWWVTVCLAVAISLVAGSSTAQAARMGSRTKLLVVGTTPATPTAGHTYTMSFSLERSATALHIAQFACYAQVGGKLGQLIGQGGNGTVDYCTWSIPNTASGKTFDGIVAVQNDAGTWFYLGFDQSIS